MAPPPLATVECALAELGEVEIVRVTSITGSALWRGMMDAHHYLKSGPLCGAQLRYLVRSERYGWIAGCTCARRVECRASFVLARWAGADPQGRGLACATGLDRGGVGRGEHGRCALDREALADDRPLLRPADGEYPAGLGLGHGGQAAYRFLDAVRLLGRLGGHLGRTADGPPGTEVFWRGMARLADIEFAYDLYH